jgi:hypothetical protein
MNRIIAVLINHCKCHEKGTNIVAGIKCVYERKYGIHVGVAKEGAALRLSEVRIGQWRCPDVQGKVKALILTPLPPAPPNFCFLGTAAAADGGPRRSPRGII